MLLRQYPAWLLLCAASCGASDPADSMGLQFDVLRQDLGAVVEGSNQQIRFTFATGGAHGVVVEDIQSSCGCLDIALFDDDGRALELGQELPAHTSGELRATWKTAGYSGPRESTLQLLGRGPGLPVTLRFSGDLETWYQLDPRPVTLLPAERHEQRRARVTVRAKQPFRLLDRLSVVRPLEVEGIPSETAALEQSFEVVLPADSAEEGQHRGFVQIRTDQELPVIVPVIFTVASAVALQPTGRFMAGAIRGGQAESNVLSLTAREGTLGEIQTRWEGPVGVQIHVVTLEDQRRYQLQLAFAEDLAAGPLSGTIHVSMMHHSDGRQQRVERAVPFLGVVQ